MRHDSHNTILAVGLIVVAMTRLLLNKSSPLLENAATPSSLQAGPMIIVGWIATLPSTWMRFDMLEVLNSGDIMKGKNKIATMIRGSVRVMFLSFGKQFRREKEIIRYYT